MLCFVVVFFSFCSLSVSIFILVLLSLLCSHCYSILSQILEQWYFSFVLQYFLKIAYHKPWPQLCGRHWTCSIILSSDDVSSRDNCCQIIKYLLRNIGLMASIVKGNPAITDCVISCKSFRSLKHPSSWGILLGKNVQRLPIQIYLKARWMMIKQVVAWESTIYEVVKTLKRKRS